MNILNVEKLTHGFGERAIFNDVSFRLLKGNTSDSLEQTVKEINLHEYRNRSITTDEGKIEWSKNVKVGYLDQHTVLEPGMTVRSVLQKPSTIYLWLKRVSMNCIWRWETQTKTRMNAMLEEVGELQERLDSHDFYILDAKIDEVARALGVAAFGMDSDVSELSGGQRTKSVTCKTIIRKTRHFITRRADKLLGRRTYRMVETLLTRIRKCIYPHFA